MVMRLLVLCTILLAPAFLSANENISSTVKAYKNGKEIQFSNLELWQRQLLTIRVNFSTDEEFSYISVDALRDPSFIFKYKIEEKNTVATNTLFNKSVLLYFWPLKSGDQNLTIPNIVLKLSGRVINKYALSHANISVKPLPAYLPPGFPVGEIKIENQYSGNSFFPFFFTPGKLASYQLSTTTSGLDETFIPDYSNYLENSDITRLASENKLISTTYNDGYLLTKHYTVPMVINRNGLISFDSFKVLSFDPETAKVISYYYKPDTLLALNIPAQLLVSLIICIILIGLSRYIIKHIKLLCTRRRNWALIYQSNDARQLSSALKKLPFQASLLFGPLDKKPPNCNLTQWSESWNYSELTVYLENLNELLFSDQSSLDFYTVKQEIITMLRKHENFIYFCFTR